MRTASRILLCAAVIAVAGLAGCKPGKEAKKADGEAKISISGAWALYPMMQVWAEAYQKSHPGVQINVSGGGAGKGAADTLGGMVEIGMISREPKKDELDKGGVFFAVAKDAVVAVIAAGNPVAGVLKEKGLTQKAFNSLWISGKATTWGAVAGADSAAPVQVYTRADACGAAEAWAKYIGGKDAKQENLKGTGVPNDPGLLEAVKKDVNGIGYNNYSYVFDNKTGEMAPGIMVVPIDVNGNGRVDPEEVIDTREKLRTAIRAGIYPHPPARPLYLMTKGEPKSAVKTFILWVLKDGQDLVDGAGYLKLPDEQIKQQFEALNKK